MNPNLNEHLQLHHDPAGVGIGRRVAIPAVLQRRVDLQTRGDATVPVPPGQCEQELSSGS